MAPRLALFTLLLVPGIASFTAPHRALTTVTADDPALSRSRGVVRWHGELFTGRLVEPDRRGGLTSSTEYREGLRDGVSDAWYPNGQLSYHRSYWHGREDGVHTGWWPDGRLRFAYRYERGLAEGIAREWFAGGRLYREFHYEAGHESGSEQMWWADGTLRANYVVRDGRRFGLPGTKGCAGLDSTVVLP